MNRRYRPIPCSLYSRYERAVLSGQRLRVNWCAARGLPRIETLMPTDLRTRWGSEYMIARDPRGHIRVLRLDRIRAIDVLDRAAGQGRAAPPRTSP